jgi:carboxymethylenebutenolidase
MAELHDGDSPDATAMASEPDVAVVTESVTYGEVDGAALNGYMALPEAQVSAALPGVILIHEWWGLNDNIKTTARRLAGEGYRVLAVDLYRGRVAETGDLARQYMADAVANPQHAMTNIRSANAFLRENHDAPGVGVMGWCFGGGQAANAMVAMPASLDATVIYYGNLPTDRTALAAVESPVLGFFGSADSGIPVDGVRAFESTMDELGKDIEVTVYEGAGHAFANPSGQSYDGDAAADAWAKTLRFLEANLKG